MDASGVDLREEYDIAFLSIMDLIYLVTILRESVRKQGESKRLSDAYIESLEAEVQLLRDEIQRYIAMRVS